MEYPGPVSIKIPVQICWIEKGSLTRNKTCTLSGIKINPCTLVELLQTQHNTHGGEGVWSSISAALAINHRGQTVGHERRIRTQNKNEP